jgi:hypothetical protein
MSTAGFFQPAGNCYAVAFTAASSNIAITNASLGTVKVDNRSGNICFVSFTTSAVGNIDHPTSGAANSKPVICIPSGETTFVATGLNTVGNVWINAIAPAGAGTIYIQSGTL